MSETLTRSVWSTLQTIDDPEMPISIVDLGIIHAVDIDSETVTIQLTPTFTGCPALDLIDQEIRTRVRKIGGVASVDVEHVFDPPWDSSRISEAGRARLAEHGVTVPEAGSQVCGGQGEAGGAPGLGSFVPLGVPGAASVACPYCGSHETRLDSPFGPTRCRATHYCQACHNPFERMK